MSQKLASFLTTPHTVLYNILWNFRETVKVVAYLPVQVVAVSQEEHLDISSSNLIYNCEYLSIELSIEDEIRRGGCQPPVTA